MEKFGRAVVKCRIPILILAFVLMIPSAISMTRTRINYDMLTYLPEDMDTVIGQGILLQDFGKGAFSLVIVEDRTPLQVDELKTALEQVDHVESVIWYTSVLDLTIPMELLPDQIYDAFNREDETILAVFFDTSTSADETLQAIEQVREVLGEQCYVTGMSAIVTDLKDLCEQEEPIYVALAVLCATVVMMVFLDSWLIPFVFLLGIACAVLLNLGTNFFLGEISYITKALSAVLQLAVTMDYSIFLWHSYTEQRAQTADRSEAMAKAIGSTLTSVAGSSVTTIAGFLALCFMSFTLGKDLGLVMAKGVLLGVISSVTVLPSLVLVLEKPIEKTRHRSLIGNMDNLAGFITKRHVVFLVIFLLILGPAVYGYTHTQTYYDMSSALPRDLPSVVATTKLEDDFDMASTHMVLVDADLSRRDMKDMKARMEQVDGVKSVLGLSPAIGSLIPDELLPESITSLVRSQDYELLLISSEYHVASDAVNVQVDTLNQILKQYDPEGMLIGEAPCTADLIEVTDHDFTVVTWLSIGAIFLIIALVLRSVSLPVILVAVIEFAIFINLGIPCYTGTTLPFVAPICISTIQLGATVDYAILMTTRYKRERAAGQDKREAVTTALAASIPSILVSALGFFAATFGVGLYSDIDIISAMCNLMARGALVSMLSVIFVLPSILLLTDGIIKHTTLGFKPKAKEVLS